MKIFENIKFEIEESRILHLLGYKDTFPDEEILNTVREEIIKCTEYLNPIVYYKVIENNLNIKYLSD